MEKTLIKTPTKYYLVAGNSEGPSELNAFDGALLNSGVGNTNLVRMSSILPPKCEKIAPIEQLPYGALVPVAYASKTSTTKGEVIASAVAIAHPKDKTKPGLIMEYSASGHKEDIESIVRTMAKDGMNMRNEEIEKIESISAEHHVEGIGSTFAAVVLWD
jgi:arginine decarboxylase